jgi:hypothetical protein
MERGADVTNVEDVNENGPLDLCSGRAATRKYDGLPHQVYRWRLATADSILPLRMTALPQVKLVETLREYGARYHEERKRAKEERRAQKKAEKAEKRRAREEAERKAKEQQAGGAGKEL